MEIFRVALIRCPQTAKEKGMEHLVKEGDNLRIGTNENW